jgi:hypothetical protein
MYIDYMTEPRDGKVPGTPGFRREAPEMRPKKEQNSYEPVALVGFCATLCRKNHD